MASEHTSTYHTNFQGVGRYNHLDILAHQFERILANCRANRGDEIVVRQSQNSANNHRFRVENVYQVGELTTELCAREAIPSCDLLGPALDALQAAAGDEAEGAGV